MLNDLYFKETDRHQYLHYQSSHPKHIKKSIVYSQALCLKRNCTIENDFNLHLVDMKEWFLARGYPERVVKEQMKRIVFGKKPSKILLKEYLQLLHSILNLRFELRRLKSSLNIYV